MKVNLLLYIFRALRFLARLLPAGLDISLGRIGGAIASLLCRKERTIAASQVVFALFRNTGSSNGFSSGAAHLNHDSSSSSSSSSSSALKSSTGAGTIVRRVFEHVGMGLAESIMVNRLLTPRDSSAPPAVDNFLYIHQEGSDAFLDAFRRHGAAIALTGHIGTFELLAAYYARLGLPLSVVGRAPNYAAMHRLINQLRLDYGVETLWREEPGATMKLFRSAKNGKAIGVLIDQDVDLDNCFAPFFGLPAACPSLVLQYAVRHRIPLVTTFITREPRSSFSTSRFRVHSSPIAYDPESPLAVERIVQLYCSRLESMVRDYPEQWIWWHRRWRRRPGIDYQHHPEQLRSTEQYLAWLKEITDDPLKLAAECSPPPLTKQPVAGQ